MTSEDPTQVAAATQLLDEATQDVRLDRDLDAVLSRGTTIRRRRRLLRTVPLAAALTAALALGLPGVPGQRLPDALAGWGPQPLSLPADAAAEVEAACAARGLAMGGDAAIMASTRPTFTQSTDNGAQAVYVTDTVMTSCTALRGADGRWRVGRGEEDVVGAIVSERRGEPAPLSAEQPFEVEAGYGMTEYTMSDDGAAKGIESVSTTVGRVHPSVTELQVSSGGKRYRASISGGLFVVRIPVAQTNDSPTPGVTVYGSALATATAYDASGHELATLLFR